jgi:hypothetical protein
MAEIANAVAVAIMMEAIGNTSLLDSHMLSLMDTK